MVVDQTLEGGAWLGGRKGQIWKPLISKRGLQYQNHVIINIHILGDAMVVQRRND